MLPRKLESASRKKERNIHTRTATKSATEMATTHISLTALSIQTAGSRPLAQPLPIGDTLAAHPCRMVLLL